MMDSERSQLRNYLYGRRAHWVKTIVLLERVLYKQRSYSHRYKKRHAIVRAQQHAKEVEELIAEQEVK